LVGETRNAQAVDALLKKIVTGCFKDGIMEGKKYGMLFQHGNQKEIREKLAPLKRC
jgi:hypothetical protein